MRRLEDVDQHLAHARLGHLGAVERAGEPRRRDRVDLVDRLRGLEVREHALESRLLLLHRRQDFVDNDRWPPELAERAAALEPQLGSALRAFGERAFRRADAETMTRLRYALLDAPFGAVKPYVQARKRLPAIVEDLVATTARAVLQGVVHA